MSEEEDKYKGYGEVEVTFSSYYKYTFNFKGEGPNGEQVFAVIGGTGDDIYRFDVDTRPVTIKQLDPDHLKVSKGDKTIFEYEDRW